MRSTVSLVLQISGKLRQAPGNDDTNLWCQRANNEFECVQAVQKTYVYTLKASKMRLEGIFFKEFSPPPPFTVWSIVAFPCSLQLTARGGFRYLASLRSMVHTWSNAADLWTARLFNKERQRLYSVPVAVALRWQPQYSAIPEMLLTLSPETSA